MKLVNQTTGQDLDPNNVQLRSVMLVWTSPVIGVFGAIDVLPGTPDCIYVFVQSPLLFHYFAKFQSSHKMKKIIIIIHGFYTALFSALKQTRM